MKFADRKCFFVMIVGARAEFEVKIHQRYN
jgi:hypothetical protein